MAELNLLSPKEKSLAQRNVKNHNVLETEGKGISDEVLAKTIQDAYKL